MSAPRSISDPEVVDEIVAKYQGGASLAVLATEYGVAVTTIRNYLMREGVELRKRGRRKKA
jgi:citrate lyase alpha subunit